MSTPSEVIDRYLTAMRAGDHDTGFGFYAEDIVFRIPGRSQWAGEHRGRDQAAGYIRSALARAHHGEFELTLIDRLTSDERVALLVEERFKRPEGDVTIRRANVYRIRGEQIAEVWIFEGDQYEVDAMFAA
jgi:ketosteroid isomerase-like protein